MAITKPMKLNGRANLTIFGSNGNSPVSKMTTNGYMQMRWYQHNTHGGKCMTSLKKRLPRVEITATSQAKNTNVQRSMPPS